MALHAERNGNGARHQPLMIPISPHLMTYASAAFAILPVSATAGIISWGVPMQGAVDFDVFSDGMVITSQGFGYELGFFAAAFVPEPTNVSLWDANWVRVGGRSSLDFISGSYGGMVESDVLAAAGSGRQVYVWGEDSRDPEEDLEWVLYTGDDWVAVDTDADLTWDPASANRAIVGRIATTDPSEAGGSISRPVVLGANAIQTAAVVVPEPGVPALLMLGLSVCALRRARRSTQAGLR